MSTFQFDTIMRTVAIDGDLDTWQSVPAFGDVSDYRYSHGGAIYQEACEAYWRAEQTPAR